MTAKKKHKVIRRSARRVPIAAESEKLSSSERELRAIPKPEWEMAKRQERIVKAGKQGHDVAFEDLDGSDFDVSSACVG